MKKITLLILAFSFFALSCGGFNKPTAATASPTPAATPTPLKDQVEQTKVTQNDLDLIGRYIEAEGGPDGTPHDHAMECVCGTDVETRVRVYTWGTPKSDRITRITVSISRYVYYDDKRYKGTELPGDYEVSASGIKPNPSNNGRMEYGLVLKTYNALLAEAKKYDNTKSGSPKAKT